MVGEQLVNHFLYDGDLVIMSPDSAGLQELLRVCSDCGEQFGVKLNSERV